jgi:hypothetical protein
MVDHPSEAGTVWQHDITLLTQRARQMSHRRVYSYDQIQGEHSRGGVQVITDIQITQLKWGRAPAQRLGAGAELEAVERYPGYF